MDHATAACPAKVAPLPVGLEGWTNNEPVETGTTAAAAAALPLGRSVKATLLPNSKVGYAIRPEKPGDQASSGGVFAFVVSTPGRYRIALGSAAWVDVLSGTTLVTSAAHGHGPDCSGIRKIVDFDLKPGRYLLQVAGSGSATVTIMVAHAA
jgi:hypothetical protein